MKNGDIRDGPRSMSFFTAVVTWETVQTSSAGAMGSRGSERVMGGS